MRRRFQRVTGVAEGTSTAIEVTGLTKSFRRRHGEQVVPVDDVSFSVERGEFVVLLGPSGCGKTTLLRCIAGLEHPDAGTIELGGRTVFAADRDIAVPPERRSVGVVFQSYALWPHLTVRKNVGYPLRRSGLNREAVRAQVDRVLEMVGVPHLGEQHPGQLSGGQQQRVALARALAAGNEVILFDEPLSNVDAKVRDQLRIELLAMQAELGFAALYVTHDQTEAMELGHRIAVLREGKIEQLASPREVYRRPATPYVATFVGRTNQVTGTVEGEQSDGETLVRSGLGLIRAQSGPGAIREGSSVQVVFRPESVRLVGGNGTLASENAWRAKISSVVFGGPQVRMDVVAGEHRLEVVALSGAQLPVAGTEVTLEVDPADCWVLPSDDDGAEPSSGDRAQVAAAL